MRLMLLLQRRLRCVLPVLCLLLLNGLYADCQDISKGGIDNRKAAVSFCKQLRRAVQAKEKAAIAAWVNAYPIQIEYTPVIIPGGGRGEKTSLLIADKQQFVEGFEAIFNSDVTRSLFSNSGCELQDNPDGSAKIANGMIVIDQVENGTKTIIRLISPPTNYEEFYKEPVTRETGAKSFLMELQYAISKNDPEAVAPLCEYPLRVNSTDKQVLMNDRAELIRKYSSVFTEDVRKAILGISKPILVGWRGFMTEHGEVWFDSVYGTDVFRVRAIHISESRPSPTANK